MKTKFKKSLRIASLFLSLLFVFTNCENDETSHSNTEAPEPPPYNISTLGPLEVQQNEALSSRLNALEGSLAAQRNNQSSNREVYSSTHDFYINTSVSKYIENQEGTYHSYTFPIRRFQDNGLVENLLVSLQNDGSYRLYLVSYELTSQERSDLLEGIEVDLENKIGYSEIEDNGFINNMFGKFTSCGIDYYTVCWPVACSIDGCWDPQYTSTECVTFSSYISCNTGGSYEGDTGDGTSSGGGGSGSGGSPTPNPVVSTPVVLTMAEQLSEFLTLDDQQVIWANKQDQTIIDEIISFMLTNCEQGNNSEDCTQAKEFVLQAIEILLGGYNDLTIDELLEVLEFEQDYRNKMSDSEIDLFDTLTRDKQLNYLWSAKQASDKTEELFSTYCEKYNGKGDAFRHAYWNALSSSRIGVGLTNLLTTRHEDKPPTYPYNSKENAMDLYNNEIGRDIIWNGSTDILQDVLSAFNNGDLRYLSNQASDCRATFNSQLTPTNQ